MFSRRNSTSSIPGFRRSSSVRRRKSAIVDINSNSKLLESQEISRQAIAAAQYAFVSGRYTPDQNRPPKQRAPVPAIRRTGLSEIDPNQPRPAFMRPSNLRFSRCGAPPESVTSQDYGAESIYSEVTPPRSALDRFYPSCYDAFDDDDTIIIHRRSPPAQGSGSYPSRIFRDPSYETLSAKSQNTDQEPSGNTTPRPSPNPISSTPSSFKRLGRSKSMMAMSTLDCYRDYYSVERTPVRTNTTGRRLEQRKSISFLRGGTDFMPQSMKQQQFEAKPRQRVSFYTPSSDRPMRESSLYRVSMTGYRGRNERGEWGALRWAVKRKARRITQMFGSVKNVFGKKKGGQDADLALSIPEQHVASTRPYLGNYIPSISGHYQTSEPTHASRVIPMGPRDKPKIRSSYVVSRPPSLHVVPSYEQVRSDVSSISEINTTPEPKRLQTAVAPDPYETVSTWSSLNWDSTVASQSPILSNTASQDNILEQNTSTLIPGGAPDFFFTPPRAQRRDRVNVDVRRLYSALVKKMDDSPPQLKAVSARESSVEEHIPTLASNVHPELARALEARRAALSTSASRHASGATMRRASRVSFKSAPGHSPTPVSEVPKVWHNADRFGDMERGSPDEYPASIDAGSTVSSAKKEAQYPEPSHSTTTVNPMLRSASKRKREVSFAEPCSSHRTATDGGDDEPLRHTPSPGAHSNVHVDSDDDGQLTQWNLQMLKRQGSSPSVEPRTHAWHSHSTTPKKENAPPSVPCHLEPDSPSMEADLNRPRSAAAYRYHNSSTPIRRTATAMGYTPVRTGLVARDVNLPPTAYAFRDTSLEQSGSRISTCGRQSRASMKNFNVSEAVRRQFGPVTGDEDDYYRECLDNRYGGSVFL